MKNLWLPLFYVSIPWIVAFLLIKWSFIRSNALLRWMILFMFISLALWLTGLSLITSIEGMREKGLKCLNGIIVFPPIGIGAIVWYVATVFKKKF